MDGNHEPINDLSVAPHPLGMDYREWCRRRGWDATSEGDDLEGNGDFNKTECHPDHQGIRLLWTLRG
jgi:hypothetical protein